MLSKCLIIQTHFKSPKFALLFYFIAKYKIHFITLLLCKHNNIIVPSDYGWLMEDPLYSIFQMYALFFCHLIVI